MAAEDVSIRRPTLDEVFLDHTSGDTATTEVAACHHASPSPGRAAPVGRDDGLAAAERLLTKLRHDPAAISLTLGAPVVLVVIFGYIFGSAIAVPGGGNYRAYLIPGLFATIAANIMPSMVAMARDSTRGVVDRFRSLPITRAAVPFGQAAATAVYGLVSFVLMGLCGLAVGWRIDRGAGDALAALGPARGLPVRRDLGRHVPGPGDRQGGDGRAGVDPDLPGHHAVQRVRAHRGHAGLAARDRRLEPGQRAGRRDPAAVRQPGRARQRRLAAGASQSPPRLAWTALLLVVFVPLCTARYARPE